MAGESPDRSKQRESSAEPTSGSASPVPEARSEAPPKRDPRLAVARDTERSAKRGGADTATRVLSTRTAEKPTEPAAADRDESESDSAVETERVAGAAGTADAERDESDTGTEGTAADAEQDASAVGTDDAEREESDTGAEGAAGASASAKSSEPADSSEPGKAAGSTGSSRSAGGSESGEASKPGEASDSGEASGSTGGSESGKAAGAEERGDDAAGSDGRLRDAVAAWVASADQDEEPAAAKGADKGSGGGQEAAERAEELPEAAEADTDAQKPEKPAEADADARDDREAEGAADDAEAATATQGRPEAEDTDDGTKAATDTQDQPKTEDTDADAQDRPEAGGTDDGADVKDRPEAARGEARGGKDEVGEPEADRSGTGGPAGASEAASAGSTTADDAEGDAPKADSAEPDADDTRKGDAEPPVDQPTAVFKAVRPPVDQPTTMLKLGGAAEDAPEKDAERTSKFVALKPLDDPSTRKPASGAEAGQATPPAPADATAPVPTVGPERTTQQPLPPRPPLDLLAELTNTPPPPDTPLRTAVRRVKIWTPLVLLLVVVLGVVQSVRPLPAPTLELTAEDSYTFEGGKVDIPWPAKGQAALDVQGIGTFGSSGEQKPVPIASVAKVMTAYLILREHPLKSGEDGPKIEIDQAAEDQSDAGQESTVDVTKGDKISEREALESILIASANNVARLLARWDAGSEKAFVRKMNDAAKDLGMKNTTYTDPSGLNNTTVSTAVDQVKLAKAAMEQPAFREVAAMMSYVDYKGTKHDNWNRLVGYNDVTGIKTGTTTSALGNLVFSARKDVDGETRRIVGAVVRQPAGGPDNTILGAALYEGDRLIKAAQGALESATILKKGDVVGYADDGLGGRTPVVATEDVTAVGWAGLSVKLTFAADELPHQAKAGTKVGTLTVGDGSTNAVKVPVALQKDLVEPGFADKLTRLG
ncbi:D-alanyl-D-alanine carboxypeptidase [Streptomyces chartreusis]|uniref:D-alanyl-D-alanine carboxypeptidase n=1 Tax=Streptomyces chartreusis TaxID=1969 RepID=UPI0033B8806F